MMRSFRNAEVRKTLLLYFSVSVIASAAAFMTDVRFGWFTAALCAVFITVYTVSTRKRYNKIAALSADIDRILHGDSHISPEEYSEGELAILHSEIHKMTVRLREQQQNLRNDKIYLADSIADISHQIRTPLTSINLLVSLLSEPNITEERRQDIHRELQELLARIDWLITTLLKISKLDAGTVQFKSESIGLDSLISRAVSPLLISFELREQTLAVDAAGGFCGDIGWTQEALTNIIKNCMEHTPDGGKIQINATDNALYTEITIADSGTGIHKDDLPHIFERFYKGKNSDNKSFGIGLALARMIITSQNGTVKAENLTPNGAKFTVKFYKGTV